MIWRCCSGGKKKSAKKEKREAAHGEIEDPAYVAMTSSLAAADTTLGSEDTVAASATAAEHGMVTFGADSSASASTGLPPGAHLTSGHSTLERSPLGRQCRLPSAIQKKTNLVVQVGKPCKTNASRWRKKSATIPIATAGS